MGKSMEARGPLSTVLAVELGASRSLCSLCRRHSRLTGYVDLIVQSGQVLGEVVIRGHSWGLWINELSRWLCLLLNQCLGKCG